MPLTVVHVVENDIFQFWRKKPIHFRTFIARKSRFNIPSMNARVVLSKSAHADCIYLYIYFFFASFCIQRIHSGFIN